MEKYLSYVIKELENILSVDSPTGYTEKAVNYVKSQYDALGYQTSKTVKGGLLVSIGGKDKEDAILVEAHLDTLGGMVCEIKSDGRLKISPLGGLNPNNVEAENCKVITREQNIFEGTLQLINASIHVNGDFNSTKRTFHTMEVLLDEEANSYEDVKNLGIEVGDIVAVDPRFRYTESGYIKSRFLDDKLSVAILLGYAKYIKNENIEPDRMMYHHITVFEEVGHGACATVPTGVTEILAVDMGCIGDGLTCTEKQVSICAKDSRGPYYYDVVSGLIQKAKEHNLDYAVDVYPYYGSDAQAALTAGHDVRHGLIGPGVYASHGYERSHVEGVKNTMELLRAYIG